MAVRKPPIACLRQLRHAHPPGQPARRPRYGPQRPVIPPSGIPPSAVRRRDTVMPGPAPTETTGSSALATPGGATTGGTTPAAALSAASEDAGDDDGIVPWNPSAAST